VLTCFHLPEAVEADHHAWVLAIAPNISAIVFHAPCRDSASIGAMPNCVTTSINNEGIQCCVSTMLLDLLSNICQFHLGRCAELTPFADHFDARDYQAEATIAKANPSTPRGRG
jgi:hypothetical protein